VTDPLDEHYEVDGAGLRQLDELDRMLERPSKPVKLRNDELVTRPVRRQECLVELWASCELARRCVDQDRVERAAWTASCCASRGRDRA
jgi:hypothetical protein